MTDISNDAAVQRHNGNGRAPRLANNGDLIQTYAAELGLDGHRFFNTLTQTMFPGNARATVEQVQALCVVAREYGLNPFTKELYAFPGKGGGIVPIVSVDGWYKLANGNPDCEGIEVDVAMEKDGKTPTSATARVYRKGWKAPVTITEYLHEVRRPTEPWKKQPVRMLRHRAMVQAIRIAFGFSGIYEADEAARFAADVPPELQETESSMVTDLNERIDAVDDERLEERKRTIETKAKVHEDAREPSPVERHEMEQAAANEPPAEELFDQGEQPSGYGEDA